MKVICRKARECTDACYHKQIHDSDIDVFDGIMSIPCTEITCEKDKYFGKDIRCIKVVKI